MMNLWALDVAKIEDEVPAGPPVQKEVKPELTWVEIRLIGEDHKPIPGERYRIELPDGSVREGTLDAEWLARADEIDPGTCIITFPALDEEAWTQA
jgi:hypothetical protein